MKATTQSLNYGYAPEALAEFIHYRSRVFLLNSLREICRARVDDSQPYEIRTLLTQYVSQLLSPSSDLKSEGLIQGLINLLKSHYSSIASKNNNRYSFSTSSNCCLFHLVLILSLSLSKSRRARDDNNNKYFTAHSMKETKLVCECLFYVYYCDPQNNTTALFRDSHLEQLIALIDTYYSSEESASMQQINSMLVFTVFCVLLSVLGVEKGEEVLFFNQTNSLQNYSFD